MPTNILYFETKEEKLPPNAEEQLKQLGNVQKFPWANNAGDLEKLLTSNKNKHLLFATSALRKNSEFCTHFQNSSLGKQIIWVEKQIQTQLAMEQILPSYSCLTLEQLNDKNILRCLINSSNPERSVGIKCFLKQGSTVFSETFYQPETMVSKLNPVFIFTNHKLPKQKSYSVWGAINALLLEAFIKLTPEAKEKQNPQIQLQIGTDDERLCIGLRYELEYKNIHELAEHLFIVEGQEPSPWLLAKQSSDYFEIRTFQNTKQIEVISIFSLSESKHTIHSPTILCFAEEVSLENPEEVGNYQFKAFAAMKDKEIDKKITVKKDRNFKKKFSERIEGTTENMNDKTVVKGKAEVQPETEATVKGVTEHIIDEKTIIKADKEEQIVSGPSLKEIFSEKDPDKKVMLMKSKIESLQANLNQREELIKKLNKEIEEINDPMKRGVVGNVIDKQKQGLQDHIKLLETQLIARERKEKELMTMADKAIQARDEAAKQLKELDVKLKQNPGGNNARTVQLEKQVELLNKQKTELTTRIGKLMDQLNKAGLKAAA